MIDWKDYVDELLSQDCSFDGVTLSLEDGMAPISVPPMIKASILMLDRMVEHQGKYNILVFPEKQQSIFLFTLIKLLYNISEGRIERKYDPNKFHPGEKLRFGNAVVEFLGTEQRGKELYMCLQLADLKYSAPISYMPLFQKTTSDKLSRDEIFQREKKKANELLKELTDEAKYLKLLHDFRTHMNSSIVDVTSVTAANGQLAKCLLCGEPVRDNVLIGKVDYEGNVRNIGTGKLAGTPAIVLASDLYAVSALARNRHPIQSIIIDGSNSGLLASQMDALDELIRLGFPITCVTDTVNSFELNGFMERGFNVWRWDETSITEELYGANSLISDKKTKNCSERSIEYRMTDGKEISSAVRKLFLHKNEAQNFSASMLKVYDDLFGMTVSALRETVTFGVSQIANANMKLEECADVLSKEKVWLNDQVYQDLTEIISDLHTVYSSSSVLKKNEEMEDLLLTSHQSDIILVAPERSDRNYIQAYWQNWLQSNGILKEIRVVSPGEYCQDSFPDNALTVVAGWYNQSTMKRILYSYNTDDYVVMLYDYEKRWKNGASAKWTHILSPETNRQTIEKSFATDRQKISVTRFIPIPKEPESVTQQDEFDELEAVIRGNRYRQYISQSGSKQSQEAVEAIPVGFVGGFMSFYRSGHKVVSATDVILNDADSVESVLPEKLTLGDFVVVREADKDLIRDIADRIMEREGNTGARETAKIWQEALDIEWIVNSEEQIYKSLCYVGFTRGEATLHRWLTEKDLIAPQSKKDLEYIAEVTGSDVLGEKLDQIWNCAQTVKAAHTRAGRFLSNRLKNRIAEVLNTYGDFDPYNVWEPIEMQVEEIGTVRILKVIDIGQQVMVDASNTNRLLAAE